MSSASSPSLDEVTLDGVESTPEDVRRRNVQQHIVQYLADHGHGSLQAQGLIGDPSTTIAGTHVKLRQI